MKSLCQALFIVIGVAACAHHDGGAPSPAVERGPGLIRPVCRFGRDYGSGMVAIGLPHEAHRGYVLAHESFANDVPNLLWTEASDAEPYVPHISLIYGVNENNRRAVAASLGEQAQLHEKVLLEFDDLAFWDLGDTGKTALVATLRDRDGHLAALHDALQPLTGRPDRYPYQPHITIAYLQRGTRPPSETLRHLRDRLTSLNTSLRVAWLTDRCGLANGYEALGGGTRCNLSSDKNCSLP